MDVKVEVHSHGSVVLLRVVMMRVIQSERWLVSALGFTSCQGSRIQSSGCCCWCWTEGWDKGREVVIAWPALMSTPRKCLLQQQQWKQSHWTFQLCWQGKRFDDWWMKWILMTFFSVFCTERPEGIFFFKKVCFPIMSSTTMDEWVTCWSFLL